MDQPQPELVAGLPPPATQPAMREVFCARDRATALRLAGPALGGKYADYARWGQDEAMPEEESFAQLFDELLSGRFVLGSPEECYEQLRPYWEELGVDQFRLWCDYGPDHEAVREAMEMFAADVMAPFRRARGIARPDHAAARSAAR